MQKEAVGHETESRFRPETALATSIAAGLDHVDPSQVNAYPASSTAAQKLGVGHETDVTWPRSGSISCGLPHVLVPELAAVARGAGTVAAITGSVETKRPGPSANIVTTIMASHRRAFLGGLSKREWRGDLLSDSLVTVLVIISRSIPLPGS